MSIGCECEACGDEYVVEAEEDINVCAECEAEVCDNCFAGSSGKCTSCDGSEGE